MAQRFKAKTLLSNSGVFSNEVVAPNLVYNTGNQNISGVKNFYSRPTINGTGIVLSGEAAALPTTIVYQTGNQTISGQKWFVYDDPTITQFTYNNNYANLVIAEGYGPSVPKFKALAEYRPVTFGQPSYYYSGIGYETGSVQIYFDTGDSRWKYYFGGSASQYLIAKSPVVTPNNFEADFPLKGWTNNSDQILDIKFSAQVTHNESHASGQRDAIDPSSIGAVALTGNQSIFGIKNFISRPTVNGTGILFSGEAAQVDLGSTVRTTGNQTVSGIKTFIDNQIFSGNIQVSGTGIFKGINLDGIDNLNLSGVDITITSGSVSLTNRPTVNGTGVLLSGETAQVDLTSTVRTTGNQTVSGIKTFANPIYGTTTSGLNLIGSTPNTFGRNILISGGSGTFYAGGSVIISAGAGVSSSGSVEIRGSSVDVYSSNVNFQNSPIANASAALLTQTTNFTINSAFGSDIVLVNSTSQVTGTISSGLANGFNVSIHQIGTGQVVITGSGLGVTINSYGGQYKTAGQYAAISLLHTGNNGYLMYGNTAL